MAAYLVCRPSCWGGSGTEVWDSMRNRLMFARRRRMRGNRSSRTAVWLAIPAVVGLGIGVVIAVSGRPAVTDLGATALGASASPSASAPAAAPSVAPSATGTGTGTATTTAAANVNCDIIVPHNALTARGLATPYQLTGTGGQSPAQSGCEMTNAVNLGAFVQATILNPATGRLFVYDPLVVTAGTTPAVAPVVPVLPRNAIVTIDFGFNGTDLYQVGAGPNTLRNAHCVNGTPGSVFGQVSFCNGTAFFTAAFRDEREGKLVVPSEGTSAKIIASGGKLGSGQDCPETRNFDMVDQDPSDNVTTLYLLNPATGQTAQDTTSNSENIPGSTLLANGSDNTLLDLFMDPVLGCTPFQAPDLADNDMPTSSQAMDELLSAAHPPKVEAFVPENDEMVLNNDDQFDPAKDDLYRQELGQAPISAGNNKTSSPAMFCQNMVDIQTPFLAANQTLLATGQSPVTGVGDNLFTFLANRLNMSFTNLSCQNFGLANPVMVTLNGQGVAIAATLNTTKQTATNSAGTPAMPGSGMPGSSQRMGRSHHRLMDPSGM
jgi:hypothetical protein